MLTLELEINGKKKEFKQKGIKVRALRDMMKFQQKMDKVAKGELELSPLEQIDEMILLTANLFDDPKVNFDTIIDGIEADQLETVLGDLFNTVGGGEVTEKKK